MSNTSVNPPDDRKPGPRTRYIRKLEAARDAAEKIPPSTRFSVDRTTPAAAAIDEIYTAGAYLRNRDPEIKRLRRARAARLDLDEHGPEDEAS